MDIEKVAKENPEKIITTKVELKKDLDEMDKEKIIKPFNLKQNKKRSLKNNKNIIKF